MDWISQHVAAVLQLWDRIISAKLEWHRKAEQKRRRISCRDFALKLIGLCVLLDVDVNRCSKWKKNCKINKSGRKRWSPGRRGRRTWQQSWWQLLWWWTESWTKGKTQVKFIQIHPPLCISPRMGASGIVPLLVRVWSFVNRSKWQGSGWRSERNWSKASLHAVSVMCICVGVGVLQSVSVCGWGWEEGEGE